MTPNVKKLITAVLIAAFFALFAAGCGGQDAAADKKETKNTAAVRKVLVGAPNASKFMFYKDEKGNFTGYEIEVLRKIAELLPQYEFEFLPMENTSIFPSLDGNKLDIASANLRRTEAREKNHIRTTKAYNYSPFVFLVPADNNTIHSIQDLEGKKVAVTQGTIQSAAMERYIKENHANIELVYAHDYPQLMASGRVDAAVSPAWRTKILNDSFDKFKFKVIGVLEGKGPEADPNTYFFFRKEDTKLRDDIDAAIVKLRENGTLSALSKQWLGEDYPSKIDTSFEK